MDIVFFSIIFNVNILRIVNKLFYPKDVYNIRFLASLIMMYPAELRLPTNGRENCQKVVWVFCKTDLVISSIEFYPYCVC